MVLCVHRDRLQMKNTDETDHGSGTHEKDTGPHRVLLSLLSRMWFGGEGSAGCSIDKDET
jgi:hypothetical protein